MPKAAAEATAEAVAEAAADAYTEEPVNPVPALAAAVPAATAPRSLDDDEAELRAALLRRTAEKAEVARRHADEARAASAVPETAVVGEARVVARRPAAAEPRRRLKNKQRPPAWYGGKFLAKVRKSRRPAPAAVDGPLNVTVVWGCGDELVSRNVFTCRWYCRSTKQAKIDGLADAEMRVMRRAVLEFASKVWDRQMR